MNSDTSNNSESSVPLTSHKELLQDLSDATDSLQDELDETIETLRDVATALKSWNAELEKTLKGLDKE